MKRYSFSVVILKFLTLGHKCFHLYLFVSFALERLFSKLFHYILPLFFQHIILVLIFAINLYNAESF